MRLEGRTAVITGAAGGIGRAIAVSLARRGCHLALADINETGLAETAELAEEIDVERARRANEQAEKILQSNAPDIDYPRTLDALKRAEARLDVAAKRG